MSESFVPFVARNSGAQPAAFTSLVNKAGAPVPLPTLPPATKTTASVQGDACAKPVVTLQRNGDTVTGIRVQCGCGQVIELACVF